MANDTEVIVGTFQEVRRFYRDVALLLQTSDVFFRDRDWRDSLGSTCFWTGTTSLATATKKNWFPVSFFRAYKHDKHPKTLAFVSVLIELPSDPKRNNGAVLLTACALVCSAPINCEKLKSAGSEIFRWHVLRPNHDDSGRTSWHRPPLWPNERLPKELIANADSKEEASKVIEAVTLARPLDGVTREADLAAIIDALLKEIENQQSAA